LNAHLGSFENCCGGKKWYFGLDEKIHPDPLRIFGEKIK
jgi:hypothetical protein